ncbi:APC family permease [Nocardia mexicana]|uniref:Amino acid/polyamine/organocation transporter (APC superfamily) n=1 Tax=Nocardia mexicana TaxID=279262 RepID=A0A370GGM3_9NOCA|nr:APC family permease [Nocardia mexicana]RDI41534.1 amino acid/polyamine/organocation transporter (APC superfamily) [Nocardia mexicana]
MNALTDAVARSFAAAEPDRPAVSPLRALGRRRLSGAEVLGQSVATTAPAASMVMLPVTMFGSETLLPGLVTIVVATVVITLIACCVAQFTRRLAAAGGLYTFVFQGLRTRAALICGIGLLVKYLGSAALTMYHGGQAALAVAAQLGITVRGAGSYVVYLAIAAIIGCALVRGVRFAAVVTLAVEACSLAFIVGLMLLPGSADQVAVAPPGSGGPGVLLVALTAVFSLAGFDSATFFAPETRRPLVTVTRAVLLTPMICGTLFILAAWAAWSGRAGALVNAYLHGTSTGVSPLVVVLLNLGLTASWLGSSMASSNAVSRLVYTMGIEGVLPRVFTRVNRRLRTPSVALAVIVSVVTAGAMAGLALGGVPAEAKMVVRTALCMTYILVAVASVRFLLRIHEMTRRERDFAVVGAVTLSCTLGLLFVTDALRGSFVAAGAASVIVAAGIVWHRRTGPRIRSAIGVFDSPESADVLPGAGVFAVNERGRMALVGARHLGPGER